MRDLILQRIFELASFSEYAKENWRWKYVMVDGVHYLDLIWDDLTDQQVIELFEQIVRQWTKQG